MQSQFGKYCIVTADTPADGMVKIGVLLQDPESDSLRLRFRRDLESLAEEEEDLDVLRTLGDDLTQKAREMGAEKLFEYLESKSWGTIRVTDREEVLVQDFERALNRLYLKNVQSNVFHVALRKASLPRILV